MSMPPIVFIDTETTGLHAAARPWEIAMIRREPPRPDLPAMPWMPDAEHWLMVSDVDVRDADLRGLKIGGFHDRHPSYGWRDALPEGLQLHTEYAAARLVEQVTRDAVLIGSNPAYDARVLEAMLHRHGLLPAWHYRTVDLSTYAAGRLDAIDIGEDGFQRNRSRRQWPDWRSEQTAQACGVTWPQEERHTALGDARWCQAWWDQLDRKREVVFTLTAHAWAHRVGLTDRPLPEDLADPWAP